ncbi:hypothetical protein [Lactiplantibacillus fabifermentans]|uniref:Extracellular protein n=2 Tax=Lactiplantibacillus fabifermentans TaxID=483011 RepID=A0A0R2NQE0_9LACO|nr:hypothetical protein [Lactiplantibacillus fabifermentans]ETY73399.1 hypothetical protein LFAB_12505 [Lactiplantibacillus fabifermentans T30PCM01]KRO27926.1 hypothetical protein DY78_GL002777 [Lactiplantibacillus fabifermentans DSM 21115]
MDFTRKAKLGIFTATGALVLGLVAAPSVNHVLHAASDNVSTVSQTAAPTTVKATDQKVTADSASGTKSNYSVSYVKSGTDTKTATYKQTDYNSSSDASNKVDYLSNTNGDSVTLNNGETATVQGTMGRVYVHWNTGNWSVTTVANTQDVATNPTKFANQVNKQIENQDLTSKKVTSGAVTVYNQPQSGEANSVKWQKSDTVSQVQGQQASTVLKIAATTKE